MPITLKDIAKLSGVSVATASLALNNNKLVHKKTKKRVLGAAKALKYERNTLARGLRMNKTYTIGLACEHPKLEFIEAVVRMARERGYHVITQQFAEYDVEEERNAYQSLLSRRVDGVLSWPSESGLDYASVIGNLYQHNIPVVIVDRNIPNIRVPSFCFDDRRGMKLAWLHLWRLGRNPIIYVDFKKDVSSVQARREGIRDAHLEVGLRWDEKFHVKALGTMDGTGLDHDLVRQALDMAKGGGAILTATDLIAFAIIRMNMKMKIAMPEEVALVGFEDEVMLLKERVGWITSPPLTTVRMHFDQMGGRATEFLLDFLEKPKDKRSLSDNNKVFLIEPQLVVRESCGGQPGIYGFDKNDKICFLGEEDS